MRQARGAGKRAKDQGGSRQGRPRDWDGPRFRLRFDGQPQSSSEVAAAASPLSARRSNVFS